jgi:Na+-translocating ferredoxin:NAD+ oxidoreductase RnfC subunit
VVVTLLATDLESHEYYIPSADYKVLVKKKDKVNEKQILAKSVDGKNKLTAIHAGIVEKIDENVIIVKDEQAKLIEYRSDAGRNVSVKK